MSKKYVDMVLKKIAKSLDIGDDLFEKAENEYKDLGALINEKIEKSNLPYSVKIYPQGSMALGTIVRPITDKDDYDIDFVCQFMKDPLASARDLKCKIVKPWLEDYCTENGCSVGYIEEKKRCWHVEKNKLPNFHIDVIPGYKLDNMLKITNHDEIHDTYNYIGSNPKGYIEWFQKQCDQYFTRKINKYHIDNRKAEIEELKRNKSKTPLQQAIQIMKRHRDIMYKDNPDDKPISIIITTIMASVYDGSDSVSETIYHFLDIVGYYIKINMQSGKYCICNPTLPNENFADKWNADKSRAKEFFRWIKQARQDFCMETSFRLDEMEKVNLAERLKRSLGKNIVNKVYDEVAEGERHSFSAVSTTTGILGTEGVQIVPHTHYGE